MGKFQDIMIVSDGDGTLLNSSHQIPEKNLAAIRSFTQQGGLFVLASGRPKNGARHIVRQLPPAPVVYFNGALICDSLQGKVLYSDPLPTQASQIFAFLLKQFPDAGLECFTIEHSYVLRDSKATRLHLKMLRETPGYVSLDQLPRTGILKIFATGTCFEQTLEIQRQIQAAFPGLVNVMPSGSQFLEIFSPNSNKGSAVEFLKSYYPNLKRVYAVGDNYNDLPMFQYADLAFVPSNGVDNVKQMGKVVSNCDCGALYDVVDYLDTLF